MRLRSKQKKTLWFMKKNKQVHLGESVYVEFDGVHFILSVSDGNPDPISIIFLDPEVMFELVNFYQKTKVQTN